jgi:hypothetical protein
LYEFLDSTRPTKKRAIWNRTNTSTQKKKKLQKMTQPKRKDIINLSITKKSPKDSSTRGHVGRRRQ